VNSLSATPYIRVLPAYISGIIFSFYSWFSFYSLFWILPVSVFLYIFSVSEKNKKYSRRWLIGISFQLVFFFAAWSLNTIQKNKTGQGIPNTTDTLNYIMVITSQPEAKSFGFRCEAEIRQYLDSGEWKNLEINCLVYFKDATNALSIGDCMIVKNILSEIKPPANPGQFDQRFYLSTRRIHYSLSLNQKSWKKCERLNEYSIFRYAQELRNKLLQTFTRCNITGQEYAVLSALVLGYDDDIDNETRRAFSASGTMHILSVSGMHVGILFTAVTFLLAPLNRNKGLRKAKFVLLISALWFYAFLTGLSPSVIRSAMMFSFIVAGATLRRSSSIYNSLAASALFICAFFEPLMIFSIGFQLSFLAVVGIAFIHPIISKLLYFDKSFFQKTWELISVSLAAQLATFPLGLYYFHQFPNYFILANLLMIPLSTIAIFGGIALLAIPGTGFVAVYSGWLVGVTVKFLNLSAAFIEKLPYAVTNRITVSLSEVILLYIFIVLITLFIADKSLRNLQLSLFILGIYVSLLIFDRWEKLQMHELIIFSSPELICRYNRGIESWIFCNKKDSTKALRLSENYSLSEGLAANKLQIIHIDSVTDIRNDYFNLIPNKILAFPAYYIQPVKNHQKYLRIRTIALLKEKSAKIPKVVLWDYSDKCQSSDTLNLYKQFIRLQF
jgi:competence protein ComEC